MNIKRIIAVILSLLIPFSFSSANSFFAPSLTAYSEQYDSEDDYDSKYDDSNSFFAYLDFDLGYHEYSSSEETGSDFEAMDMWSTRQWLYEQNSSGITLKKYIGDPYFVMIPVSVNGIPVTDINPKAFSDTDVETVYFDNYDLKISVNLIQYSNIQEIQGNFNFRVDRSYDEPVLRIYDSSYVYAGYFGYDPDTNTFNPPSDEELDRLKEYDPNLENLKMRDIVIPSSVLGADVISIEGNTFAYSRILNKVTLPETLIYLSPGCFMESSISKINIPEKVRMIPDDCFKSCTDLKELNIEGSIDAIGYAAFENTAFEDIYPCNCSYEDDSYGYYYACDGKSGLFNTDDWMIMFELDVKGNYKYSLYKYIGSDEVVYVPEEINGLKLDFATDNGNCLFGDNTTVKRIIFPDNITTIPPMRKCNMESVVLPESLTEIPNEAFYMCLNLKSINIPESVKVIGDSAFMQCNMLKEVNIESDSIRIMNQAFKLSGIRKIELPGNCYLGMRSMGGKVESVKFRSGKSVELDDSAFDDCSLLTEVDFDPDIEKIDIGRYAFRNTSLSEITLGKNVFSIGLGAFRDCKNLLTVNILGNAPIGNAAFSNCANLKSAVISGKHKLGSGTFMNCKSLSSVSLDTSEPVPFNTFNDCPELYYINNIEVVKKDGSEFAPELEEFVKSSFADADNIGFLNRYYLNKAKAVAKEVTNDSMSDVEKVKALHDWLCENTVYAESKLSESGNHTDGAVFMDGIAVCEGYAKTLNLLLNAAGIESWFVDNGEHSWNIVKVNGRTFHVDATWDDGDEISYKWFMLSDADMRNAGDVHAKWYLKCPSDLHSFQSTVLPFCDDEMGDINGDGKLTISDTAAIRNIYASKDEYDILCDLDFDGKITVNDIECSLKHVDSNYRIGDVNGDKMVDSSDASALLEMYAELSVSASPEITEEKLLVSDINGDRSVNAADASDILAYYNYVSTGGTDGIKGFTAQGTPKQ